MFELDRQEIKNPVGILTDPNPSDLPLEAWSEGRNIRFKDGKASKAQGHTRVFGEMPVGNPQYLMPFLSDSVPFWFVGYDDKVYRTEGNTWLDVSRATGGTYLADTTYRWNGGFLSGVAIMNNGRDVPQVASPSLGINFQNLPNWPVGLQAKILRPFKNYLVALNVTKTSVNMPTVVKWSSPADPGEVPFTWDETDPRNDAGETALADTAGAIVDGKKLRDQFIIYKEDSVYTMRYTGGVYVFQFQQLFDDVGMLAPNCAAEFDGKHFVIGQGDVYVHNGVQKHSVIDGKMKNYLFDSIQAGGVESVFVIPDYSSTEMWVCFQATADAVSGVYSDRAMVWNWAENTWTIRDLPKIFHGTYGIVDPRTPDNWDADPDSWDTDTTVWGSSTYNPAKTKLLLLSRDDKKVFVVGETSLFDTAPFKCVLIRTDLYGGDDLHIKNINSITPHVRGTGSCKVFVGSSMIQDSPVRWQGPYEFSIGKDYKVDCRVSGRYVGVRFEFESVGSWELNGYTIETANMGGKR